MKRFVLLLQVVLLLCPLAAGAQGKSKDVDELLGDAEYFFEQKNYLRALPLYKQVLAIEPDNVIVKYRLGVCYLFKADEKEQSINYLEEVKKTNPDIEDRLPFFLGRAYHINYKFDEAIAYFNEYQQKKLPPQEKNVVDQYISYCQNAKVLTQTPVEIEIKNIGAPINTENSEYVPVITADETMLIFTYKGVRSTGGLQDPKFRPDTDGEYYEDIMVSQRVGENWLSPEPIGNKINTKGHDASIALSNDGQILFIYKSTPKDKGDIFESRLKGAEWMEPVRLDKNINTGAWEGSCSLSNDGQTLYFASERPGGFGGRDIYISQRQADGTWGTARNLGPTINTTFNDDAPFIHPDGITLFFSSEGHNSIGGYDIFYTVYREDGWGKPINFGYPANTPFDERFYVLSADGATGYYSSDRKGSSGQQDIYAISPGFQGEPPVLALVVGFVTVDQKPVDATITVNDSTTGAKQGTYNTNSATGKYLIALKPGNVYRVAIEVEGQDIYYEYVNVKGLDTYVQVNKDYNFDGNKPPRPIVADSSDALQNKIDVQLRKIREEQKTDVYEQKIYKNIIKKYGEVKVDSVTYSVELGRYEDPADFDSTKLAGLGPFKRKLNKDGTSTIYAAGPFKTLLDAEMYRAKLPARDSTIARRATVTVDDRGKRRMVQDYYRKEYTRKGYEPPDDTRLIKSRKANIYTTETDVNVDYDKLVQDKGTFEAEGLSYKLELATVTKDSAFDPALFEKYGKVEKKEYPDGKVRYSMGPFKTLKEAEDFKKMLVEKEAEASKSIVTVFYFGQRQSVTDFFSKPPVTGPCDNKPVDLAWFMDKSLNNPEVYAKFLALSGNYCKEGLIYKVQIGAYRKPQNFKYPQLESYGPAEIIPYPDGITRFTLRQFKTITEAEAFRQEMIAKNIKDAWITAMYKGERKTLEELIKVNFYGAGID